MQIRKLLKKKAFKRKDLRAPFEKAFGQNGTDRSGRMRGDSDG